MTRLATPTQAKAPRPEPRETRAGRIAIVGRPNVGKSTLLNALIGEPIAITSRHPQTTRDHILGILTEEGTQFVFIDTPGIHRARTKLGDRMNSQAEEAMAGADAILFIAEATRPVLDPADLAILASLPRAVPTILVVNKVDKVPDKSKLLPLLEGFAKAHDFAAIVPISALRANGLDAIKREIKERLPIGPMTYEEDSISDRPTRFFVAEFVREQILKKTYEEVPHGVAVVVERFDEANEPSSGKKKPPIPHIDLVVIVDRESHKKIVIGHGGSLLKAIGTDARVRVERLMGRQVHLKIWVRVVPRWYESEAKLRELGYEPTQGGVGPSHARQARQGGKG